MKHSLRFLTLAFAFCCAPVLVFGQYAGTYSIGAAGHFTTIAAAFDSLEQSGVNGPVTLELIDASYSAGAGRISYIPGVSDINRVTLKPASGVSPEIGYAVLSGDSAAFLFRGAYYVTIDGSNNGTDSRDLVMTVTSGLSTFNAIYIMGSHFITIRNCDIEMPATGTSVSTGAVRMYYNSGNTASISSDILIQNNRMMGGGACFYSFGVSSLNNHENIYILDNEMGGSAPGDSIQNGCYTAYNTNIQIKRNKISVHNRSATTRGLYLGSRTVDGVVLDNEIEVVQDQATSNIYGIHLTNATGGNGAKVFNNWIKGLRQATDSAGTSGDIYGIRIEGTQAGTTDSVAFNSVYINATSNKNSEAWGTIINTGAGGGGVVFMNNIIQMTGIRGTTGKIVGLARLSTYSGLQSNYNDIYMDNADTATHRMVGAYQTGGGAVATPLYSLADWQAATGSDANSFSVDPYYQSTVEGEVDLHLTDLTAANSPQILNSALPLGETFAYDKDGVLRSLTPDMGSVEFSGINAPPSAFHLLTPADGSRYVVNPAASQTVTFAWNASTDPEGDEVQYYIQVDTSLAFDLGFGENDPDTSFAIYGGDLDGLAAEIGITQGDSVVLYWRILAYDDHSNITYSLDTFHVAVIREVTGPVFYAALIGDNEVPPVYDYGYADGTFALNADSTALHYLIVLSEAAGSVTAAHFHNAASGLNGPVVRTLAFVNEAAGGTWNSGDGEPFTPAMLDSLLGRSLYVNVHTDAYPAGNIRGQVVSDPFYYLPEPSELTAATGDGFAHLDWINPLPIITRKSASKRDWLHRKHSVLGDGLVFTGCNVYRSPDGETWSLVAHKDTLSVYTDSSVTTGTQYSYFVTAIYDIGQSFKSNTESITPVVGIAPDVLPIEFGLDQNYPNPFNPSTEIRFGLPSPVRVRLTVYNMLGQKVTTLVDRMMPAGYHHVVWDGLGRAGHRAASGIYIYRLEAGSFRATRKMMLLK